MCVSGCIFERALTCSPGSADPAYHNSSGCVYKDISVPVCSVLCLGRHFPRSFPYWLFPCPLPFALKQPGLRIKPQY